MSRSDETGMTLTAGEIVAFSRGEYSDYGIMCLAKIVKTIDLDEIKQKYFKEYPNQAIEYHGDESAFVNFLSKNCLIEEISFVECHVGEYGKIHPQAWIGKNDKDYC